MPKMGIINESIKSEFSNKLKVTPFLKQPHLLKNVKNDSTSRDK
jgi:hypothetical protein